MLHSSPPPPPRPRSASLGDGKTAELQMTPQNDVTSVQKATQPHEKVERAGSHEGGNADALAEPFLGFQHQDVLVQPYDGELRRDIEFQEQLNQMLLEMVLEFHAWSTSRPDYESASAGDALFDETQTILNIEREQEQTRLRLLEFIQRIKAALAALTGGFGL